MKRNDDHPLAMSHTGAFEGIPAADRPTPRRSRQRRLARLARLWPVMSLILLVLGPVAGWIAYRSAQEAHRREVGAAFDEELARRSRSISEQVLSYAEVLHACQP